jgi:hypothetical protein
MCLDRQGATDDALLASFGDARDAVARAAKDLAAAERLSRPVADRMRDLAGACLTMPGKKPANVAVTVLVQEGAPPRFEATRKDAAPLPEWATRCLTIETPKYFEGADSSARGTVDAKVGD